MMRTKAVLGAAAACSLAACALSAVYAFSAYRGTNEPLLRWQDPAAVARGRVLYAENCAACHGATGEGTPASGRAPAAPPHDATGHTFEHPDFALFQLTKSGVSDFSCLPLADGAMPQFERTLSDSAIIDVLSFIKSTWPAEIRERQERINALHAAQNAAVRAMLERSGSTPAL